MSFLETRQLIAKDMERWGNSKFITLFFTKKEFRLMYRYRLVNFFQKYTWLRPLYLIERILYHLLCCKCGCDIPSHIKIGGGIKILHSWGIVINSKTVIGDNFTIVSGTVIGANHSGVPRIGNNVTLGAHSLIIGNVQIGDNVEIGAGAIVTKSVPENAIVYGESSEVKRIKRYKGNGSYAYH